LTVFLTVLPKCTQAKPKDRQIQRIALTVFLDRVEG
jgi:hypothetical protein